MVRFTYDTPYTSLHGLIFIFETYLMSSLGSLGSLDTSAKGVQAIFSRRGCLAQVEFSLEKNSLILLKIGLSKSQGPLSCIRVFLMCLHSQEIEVPPLCWQHCAALKSQERLSEAYTEYG
jgi:hypothetical protein